MRWWAKALLWAAILLACAGVGAFVASRSNPFPPEVRSAEASVTPSQPPGSEEVWSLAIVSRSSHAYRVGGACGSDWRVRARLRVTDADRVVGDGVARLTSGAPCDFATAQVQADRFTLRVTGAEIEGRMELRFRLGSASPAGSQDLGGFETTFPRVRLSIAARDGAAAEVRARFEDANGDVYSSRSNAELSG